MFSIHYHRLHYLRFYFDSNNWLITGLNGHQVDIAETEINTGSLYACCFVFLVLGLDSNDPFWADESADWTSLKAWRGFVVSTDQPIDF